MSDYRQLHTVIIRIAIGIFLSIKIFFYVFIRKCYVFLSYIAEWVDQCLDLVF